VHGEGADYTSNAHTLSDSYRAHPLRDDTLLVDALSSLALTNQSKLREIAIEILSHISRHLQTEHGKDSVAASQRAKQGMQKCLTTPAAQLEEGARCRSKIR
jgi:hypothetical protein